MPRHDATPAEEAISAALVSEGNLLSQQLLNRHEAPADAFTVLTVALGVLLSGFDDFTSRARAAETVRSRGMKLAALFDKLVQGKDTQ
jgi:hypothetical protein